MDASRLLVTGLLGVICLSSCSKPQPTVIIDGWWIRDFPKTRCETLHNCGPNVDNSEIVANFLNDLRTAFAEESGCRGVNVTEYDGPDYHTQAVTQASEKPHEMLIIDFEPDAPRQSYYIGGKPTDGIRSTGTIKQIAQRTCKIAKGEGAAVQ
jgi:hypothetical protein